MRSDVVAFCADARPNLRSPISNSSGAVNRTCRVPDIVTAQPNAGDGSPDRVAASTGTACRSVADHGTREAVVALHRRSGLCMVHLPLSAVKHYRVGFGGVSV